MIKLKNPKTGLSAEVPEGFSWTTFFFGFFVPLFRGLYGYAAVNFLAGLVTMGVSNFFFCFVMNKHHVKHLIEKGYTPCTPEDIQAIRAMGIGYTTPKTAQIQEAA